MANLDHDSNGNVAREVHRAEQHDGKDIFNGAEDAHREIEPTVKERQAPKDTAYLREVVVKKSLFRGFRPQHGDPFREVSYCYQREAEVRLCALVCVLQRRYVLTEQSNLCCSMLFLTQSISLSNYLNTGNCLLAGSRGLALGCIEADFCK